VASEAEALGGWLREHAPAARRMGIKTTHRMLWSHQRALDLGALSALLLWRRIPCYGLDKIPVTSKDNPC
jgi:hypothetical protein